MNYFAVFVGAFIASVVWIVELYPKPIDNRNATARYYCGQNGGVATVNARGDAFTCRDGSSYTFHIEKVRDAYE